MLFIDDKHFYYVDKKNILMFRLYINTYVDKLIIKTDKKIYNLREISNNEVHYIVMH